MSLYLMVGACAFLNLRYDMLQILFLERTRAIGAVFVNQNGGAAVRYQGENYCTFNETLKILGIDESRLKRLVSEGEIRAFREGGQMRFRKADVEDLASLPKPSENDEPKEKTPTDDLISDKGGDLDLASAERARDAAEDDADDSAEAKTSPPAPPPTPEELLREIEGLRRTINDLQLRIQDLEAWRHSIALASGRS